MLSNFYQVVYFYQFFIFIHRLGDGPNRSSIGSHVRPSVRTSTKSFSDFARIWCVGSPRPVMLTSVTSTRSKVKVKVMELLKLRKLHISRSISSAFLTCSSKLMVDSDSMAPSLQLV